MIEIVFDDILNQEVDAIVNPANTHMLHGGGLAAVIAGAAGKSVVAASQMLAPIKTGESIWTPAGELPFRAIIHTVGPVWEGDDDAPYWRRNSTDEDPDVLLARAHESAMERVSELELNSVAFPAVSCGVFRFPVQRAAPIAVQAVREAQERYPEVERILFCVLSDSHYEAFLSALEPQPSTSNSSSSSTSTSSPA